VKTELSNFHIIQYMHRFKSNFK